MNTINLAKLSNIALLVQNNRSCFYLFTRYNINVKKLSLCNFPRPPLKWILFQLFLLKLTEHQESCLQDSHDFRFVINIRPAQEIIRIIRIAWNVMRDSFENVCTYRSWTYFLEEFFYMCLERMLTNQSTLESWIFNLCNNFAQPLCRPRGVCALINQWLIPWFVIAHTPQQAFLYFFIFFLKDSSFSIPCFFSIRLHSNFLRYYKIGQFTHKTLIDPILMTSRVLCSWN